MAAAAGAGDGHTVTVTVATSVRTDTTVTAGASTTTVSRTISKATLGLRTADEIRTPREATDADGRTSPVKGPPGALTAVVLKPAGRG